MGGALLDHIISTEQTNCSAALQKGLVAPKTVSCDGVLAVAEYLHVAVATEIRPVGGVNNTTTSLRSPTFFDSAIVRLRSGILTTVMGKFQEAVKIDTAQQSQKTNASKNGGGPIASQTLCGQINASMHMIPYSGQVKRTLLVAIEDRKTNLLICILSDQEFWLPETKAKCTMAVACGGKLEWHQNATISICSVQQQCVWNCDDNSLQLTSAFYRPAGQHNIVTQCSVLEAYALRHRADEEAASEKRPQLQLPKGAAFTQSFSGDLEPFCIHSLLHTASDKQKRVQADMQAVLDEMLFVEQHVCNAFGFPAVAAPVTTTTAPQQSVMEQIRHCVLRLQALLPQIQARNEAQDSIAYLNAGGKKICVRRQSILQAFPDSQLAVRLSGRWTEQPADLDDDGYMLYKVSTPEPIFTADCLPFRTFPHKHSPR